MPGSTQPSFGPLPYWAPNCQRIRQKSSQPLHSRHPLEHTRSLNKTIVLSRERESETLISVAFSRQLQCSEHIEPPLLASRWIALSQVRALAFTAAAATVWLLLLAALVRHNHHEATPLRATTLVSGTRTRTSPSTELRWPYDSARSTPT